MSNLSYKALETLEEYGLSNCIICYKMADKGKEPHSVVQCTDWSSVDVDLMIEAAKEIKELLN